MKERVAIHPITDEENARRIAVYRRSDGGYMYAEEQRVLFSGADESVWTSQFDHDTRSGVYDSIDKALQEAQRDVPWLNQQVAALESSDNSASA
ncbi:MAG: hypothetical protein FJ147_27705 [Deltaproteobacteria bacterium]|nr:hypothetical protein [Deltaproteobacteria bacterium]